METIADNGMVATKHPLAAEAGVKMLKKGGNAVDAAVATGFALGVVEPPMSGVGGICYAVLYLAETDEAIAVSGATKAPVGASSEMYELEPEGFAGYYRKVKGDENLYGYRSIVAPTLVGALCTVLEDYGTLSLEEVMQPAVKYAEEGGMLSVHDVATIASEMAVIARFPETAKVLLRDGFPPRVSDVLVQKNLAKTLRTIANGGREAFYKGSIAKAIISDLRKNGGLLTEEDFASASEPTIYKPGRGSYRDNDVYFMPRDCGGPTVMEILNILEGYDLRGLGHNTPKSIHLLAEVFNIAYADFHEYVGDPEFIEFPLKGLTSKGYAAEVRKRINLERAVMKFKASNPWSFEGGCTTHLSTVDKDWNMVSWTQTLGSAYGSRVIAEGTGIVLNNQMFGFNPEPGHANSIAPCKTRVGHTAPTLLLKDGLPFLNVGAPGGTKIITCIPQIITNIIDFDMGIQSAMEAPRVDAGSTFGSEEVVILDSRIGEKVRRALKRMGHEVDVVDERIRSHFARPVGILIDHETEKLRGGVDPFRPGLALGY